MSVCSALQGTEGWMEFTASLVHFFGASCIVFSLSLSVAAGVFECFAKPFTLTCQLESWLLFF